MVTCIWNIQLVIYVSSLNIAERPLTVEIGFGMGRSLVLMAKANPER